MKKMEFMRGAAKVIFEFYAKLYEKEEVTSISIKTKKQQGTYQVSMEGGFFKLFTYMTGTISYCHGSSFFKSHSDYTTYYTYNESDDHDAVLKQFAADLKKLKGLLSEVCFFSSDDGQLSDLIIFEYGKPVMFNPKYRRMGED